MSNPYMAAWWPRLSSEIGFCVLARGAPIFCSPISVPPSHPTTYDVVRAASVFHGTVPFSVYASAYAFLASHTTSEELL